MPEKERIVSNDEDTNSESIVAELKEEIKLEEDTADAKDKPSAKVNLKLVEESNNVVKTRKFPPNKQETILLNVGCKEEKIERNAQGLFPCSFCEKLLRTPSCLRRQIVSHTGEKHHTWDVCFKSFGMRHALMRHLETHEDTKPEEYVQCDLCPSRFSQRRYLKEHERKQRSVEN